MRRKVDGMVFEAAESMRRARGPRWVVLILLVLFVPSCVIDPHTGRMSFQVLPEGQINQMGVDAYQQILSESQETNNAAQRELVLRVGRRIAAVADAYRAESGKPPFDWEFKVIESPQVNAFCLPGGKVAFYTGILSVCRDETGVAVVMGHEIAHAIGGHGNARMTRSVVSKYGLAAVQAALSGSATTLEGEGTREGEGTPEGEGGETGNAAASNGAIQQLAFQALGVGNQLGSLAFDRGDESHADQLGLFFMAKAGYDPSEAARFWERMAALGSSNQPAFLSTHPPHEKRIADIKAWLPKELETYEASRN